MSKNNKETNTTSNPVGLSRTLGVWDLVFLGIGTIVGVGIFVVAGIAAATASGPAVTVSFLIAGFVSLFTALSYAELASSIGGSGGAYNYALKAFGRQAGWLVGWSLLFIYAIATAYLAIAWSGYLDSILTSVGLQLPNALKHSIADGGIINIPAILIIAFLTFLMFRSTKTSSRFNLVLVFIKLTAICFFIVVAIKHVDAKNWQDFMPFGWLGVMQGAALVFNAFVGFDILASAAGETKNPQRNLPIGIIATFVISIILYVLVAGLLTGIAPYTTLNSAAAITNTLINLHLNWVATLIGSGAIIGITAVLFGFMFGLTRVFYALSKDGFFPKFFSNVHKTHSTPHLTLGICGLIAVILASTIPLTEAIKLINLGTLAIYILVSVCTITLRITHPNLERSFKLPFNPLIPMISIISSIYLMVNLSLITWVGFLVWLIIGSIIYFTFLSQKRATKTAKLLAD